MVTCRVRTQFETSLGMRFTRRGSGRPVVFVHGWCLDNRLWMYAEEYFARSCDVLCPDLAGFGMSDHLAGPYTLERWSGDVLALLEEEKLENAVLVGFAFGAAVAMTAAAADSRQIASVVSVGAPSAAASPYDKMPRAMRRDWPGFARRSAEALFANRQSEATIAFIERMFASAPLPVAIEAVGILAAFEPEKIAASVPVPQLFIHARQDTVSPVATGEACVRNAPNGRLEVIENCGHLIVLDAKEAFHDRLAAHLASLPWPVAAART